MVYRKTVMFEGDPDEVVDAAAQGLVHHGFRVRKVSGGLEADGPQMRGNRENPMRGAGHVVVRAASGRLTVEADLAGLKTLVGFVLIFPPVLSAGLMIGLGGQWLAARSLGGVAERSLPGSKWRSHRGCRRQSAGQWVRAGQSLRASGRP